MKTEKKTKAQRIAELERKLFVAEASQSYRHHFASKALNKLSTDNFIGSGLIVSITLLSGAPGVRARDDQRRFVQGDHRGAEGRLGT